MNERGLMVGDRVYLKGKVVVIMSVVPGKKQVVMGDDNILFVYEDEVYEPIPLTVNILAANRYSMYMRADGKAHYMINGDYPAFVVGVDGEIYLEGCPMITLKYVHQFQHCLRLCELNKFADDIKLE